MRVPFRLLFVGWWMAGQSWMQTGKYPKPSVSLSPDVVTLGENVTVFCGTASNSCAKFFLYKEDPPSLPLLPKTTKDNHAEFIISITSISDAGIYRCVYHFEFHSEYSEYSDNVFINVTDPRIPKPSIKVKPGHQNVLGSDIALECRGQEVGLNFFLRKANTGEISREQAVETKAKANFSFPQVRREDAGSYICQYHRKGTPFVWSEPSDPVELILKDPNYSKPSIKVKPEGPHNISADVTIECQGPDSGITFSLLKSKNLTVLQPMKAEGDKAKFSLPPLKLEDAGKYTCQYYRGENPFIRSEPSNPARLVVVNGNPVVVNDISGKDPTIIIWASVAAGLLLIIFSLVLILLLCKKRKKGSTVKEGNQPVNRLLEQNAGTGQDDRADHDGVTYAVLSQHALKIEQPSSQQAGPETCIYASVR